MSDYIDKVDIEGTQYDIQDTATKQTADQNENDIEEIKAGGSYSTAEVDTGKKWIDNKPIFRKTFVITSNFAANIPLPAEIDSMAFIGGLAFQIDGIVVKFPYSANTIANYDAYLFGGYYNSSQNAFVFQIGSTILARIARIVMVFEYTKSS